MTQRRREGSAQAKDGSPADHVRQLKECKKNLAEALDREAAMAEILQVISSSPTSTQPVFDAIVRSGSRLFPDAAISVALPDEKMVRAVAVAESDPRRAEAWKQRFPFPLTREYMHGVAILDARIVDIPDVIKAPDQVSAGARNFLASGYRAVTMMPLMRGKRAIGALSVVRLASGPLSKEQVSLLRTFAAQAVIAIENTQLLNELRERTDALEESYALVRQQADQLETQSSELRRLNHRLEQRVSEQVAEIERMGRLRRFLPPLVADAVVSSGDESMLDSHRAFIAVLFGDIRDLLRFARPLSPKRRSRCCRTITRRWAS